jgi:hypothetical protein
MSGKKTPKRNFVQEIYVSPYVNFPTHYFTKCHNGSSTHNNNNNDNNDSKAAAAGGGDGGGICGDVIN